MNNSESDKENEIMVKINITENETLLITQEIELKTERQIKTYEKIVRELQNFIIDIVNENYEQRFEREMSEISIKDNNEKDHDNSDIRDDNDIVIENNEKNSDSDNNNTMDINEDHESNNNMGNDNNNFDIENINGENQDIMDNENTIANNEINNNNVNIEKIDGNQNNESITETNNSVNVELYQEREIKDKEKLDNLIKELVTEGFNVLEEGIDEESEDIIKLFRRMECNKLKQIINGYQLAKIVIKEREELYKSGETEVTEKVNKKI
ncbi:hypothetical protein C1646_766759 [Rhizophagus diaphanus]|nr:hypothetical protein C1646_766759 [Rhizophagus diaphanus] [Rhizophagus sp. MUCL 43196]